ncbi:2-amino-4-hydroxy-6-hydroxymethyldihydropteridine diphosphokinase [Bordetella petrii]|uniref:2-amino-4-hydroxy-6- hydroxymethyldihydropteridine diphosphokinase n=1 Tax=Bordetella petrii TaxID=94624 RepID=UPI001F60A019|nr:2-amino-4-hydroxy-6-hydroxymethyldihydropteridine diphosphokinase [Bordetella petrii]
MMPAVRAYVGLGANLGDAPATLRTVLQELAATPGILACRPSGFYRSAPVDAAGPDFINAVAAVDTTLAPLALLDALQELENRHGRLRPYKNAPRTLDLDLLLYGDTVMDTPRLILPHPRMHQRAFVLAPLGELAPGLALPQGPLRTLLAQLADQTIERLPD